MCFINAKVINIFFFCIVMNCFFILLYKITALFQEKSDFFCIFAFQNDDFDGRDT